MMRRIVLLHPFDAYAGAQRIARVIVAALGSDRVSVHLGFGGRGFLSEIPGVKTDLRCSRISTRKLLYPLWVLAALVPVAWQAARGRIVWANTVYAIAPALLAILLFPRRVVIHLHEATFPRPMHLLLAIAAWRGAAIVCVSADQARRIGVASRMLPNPVALPVEDPASRGDRLLFVGSTKAIKGFALFVAVGERLGPQPFRITAYLSDKDDHDAALVTRARANGIEIIFGEQSPATMYRDGFLLMMCSDPGLVAETFSLVAAEAVARLVPVGGAGATVLPEVLGEALAFDDPTRDPDRIAATIADLYRAPTRQAALRSACEVRRKDYSESLFAERIIRILSDLERP